MNSSPRAALLPQWAIGGLPLVLALVPALLHALLLASMLALSPAQAQTQIAAPAASAAVTATPRSSSRPDPADAKAPVPAALYLSPLRAYQGFTEPPLAGWRESNDQVLRRGGWRAYAREAREPDVVSPAAPAVPAAAPAAAKTAPAASQPATGSKPAPAGHAGHGTK